MDQTKSNRLISEKSPYLLQHAYNPVAWYPWSEEAFEKARRENKPIFLSIGYSTCHWCHVMEEESFTDLSVAQLLNESFVSIKVDREERPDIDNVYMEAVMAMAGSGGWPLSVFLTPDREPFYGGTYFPPRDQYGRPGFKTVLTSLARKWREEPSQIQDAGSNLGKALRAHHEEESSEPEILTPQLLDEAFHQFSSRFDAKFGGFGGAPKFPSSHNLSFLLYYYTRSGDRRALHIVEETLSAMMRGGIFDQLGGGFHRYSTDERWHVPHFEKMLYDQALLARSYTEGFLVTGKEECYRTAMAIFDYVAQNLTSPQGGFFSAEDADSAPDPTRPRHKVEGAFYVWEAGELQKLLGPELYPIAAAAYGIRDNGNVDHDPFGEFKNKNVFFLAKTSGQLAAEFGLTEKETGERLKAVRERLMTERNKRSRPHLDDKVLTDWNGLMISGFAYAARSLRRPDLLERAKKAACFILEHMRREDGRLLHRWRDGEAAVPGFLDDYVFFASALLEIYESSFESAYLDEAVKLTRAMLRLFTDQKNGGFFFNAHDSEILISRQKPLYDGAVPSGNSAAIGLLARLGRLTMEPEFEYYARRSLECFSQAIASQPVVYPVALMGLGFLAGPAQEIVLSGPPLKEDPRMAEFAETVAAQFFPDRVVAWHPEKGREREDIEQMIPGLKKMDSVQGKPTAYICRDFACHSPVTEIEELRRSLNMK